MADLTKIKEACLLITIDNGGLRRDRPAAVVRTEMERFLEARPYHDLLPEIDRWLGTLSPDDFETVCCGEHTEMLALMEGAPPFTSDLLNDYFDEVC